MQESRTLWPWVISHKFLMGTILSGLVAAYAWIQHEWQDNWWLWMLAGAAGLLNFGILAQIYERKNRVNRAVGIVSTSAGALIVAGLAVVVLFFALGIVLLLWTLSQYK